LLRQADDPPTQYAISRRSPTVQPSSSWAVVPPTVEPSNHQATKDH
jgi:hypothetical protein